MNCTNCQPLLSGYIDDGIHGRERAALEGHLRVCSACRALADDLASLRAAAASLETLIPPAGVWHRIAAATVAVPRRRGIQWLSWQPAAAVAMTAVLAVGLWRVGSLLQPAEFTTPTPAAESALLDSDPEAHYTVAIARLEEVTRAERDMLDTETADAMNAGLLVIDEAITESRAALRSEPQSESARQSLFAALRRKVALQQEMLTLINDVRTGNQEGEINR
jgi:hypothetical protein